MAVESPVLDEAFERMGTLDFELPNGFVNHGPMACEALAVMGCDEEIDGWARWFTEMVGEGVTPVEPRGGDRFEWADALGDYRRLPEWLGYFGRLVDDDGWAAAVRQWVPRLMPGLATALFHGAIRTAHAVRAVRASETEARQAELARALAYWSARFHPGPVPADVETPDGTIVEDAHREVVEAAAAGARHYVVQPSIFNLHGVTGAMAVELLIGHLAPEDGAVALARVRVEHAALYGANGAPASPTPSSWVQDVVAGAATSADAHQVKLVEACRRGFDLVGDGAFVDAAVRVTKRG
ncbi:MAG TPA: hypothetical protein VMF60_00010 [Acidimicrobiales bacterium]|nr:hypothetical protein [Acidimicrobiales bacterium]